MSKNKVSSRASSIQTGGGTVLLESQRRRLEELESLLADRDAVITDLQRKLAEQGELHLSAMKKLRRERDELRSKNATLVNKLAEVSRKRSFSNLTPPLPRAPTLSRGSTFQSHPHSNPRAIHHHHSVATLPALPSPSLSTNSAPRQTKSVSFFNTPSNQDSDTDYSDLEEEEPKVDPKATKKVIIKQKKMSDSSNGGAMEVSIKKELAAVMDSSNSVTPILLGYNKKPEEVIKSGRQPSASPPTPRANSRRDSTSSSGSDGREASYTFGGVVERSSPALRRSNTAQQWSPKMNGRAGAKISSSDGVASAIQEILKNSHDYKASEKTSPKATSESSNSKSVPVSVGKREVSFSVDQKKTRISPSSSPSNKTGESSDKQTTPSSRRPKEGGVAVTRALFERLSSQTLMEVPPPKEESSSQSTESKPSGNNNSTDETVRSEDDSKKLSGKEVESATDPGSEQDEVPPLPTTIPGHPVLNKFTQPDQKCGFSMSASNILMDKNKRFCISAQNMSARDDFNMGEEDEDVLGEMDSFECLDVRARTSTVSGSLLKGTVKVGIGRKRMKDQRKENLLMKRATSQVTSAGTVTGDKDFARDMDALKHSFELLSPLLGAKIKDMALRKIYEKYGGKDVVKHAVEVIAQAWQSYRLRKRFLERLREKSQNRAKMRERAKSLRNVNRRPSILQKGGRGQYRKANLSTPSENRDVGKLATTSVAAADPMTQMKEKAAKLGKERVGHTHSGARLELMEKKRSSFGQSGDNGSTTEEDSKRSSLAKESLTSPGASISEESIDLSTVKAVMDGQNSVDDSVFIPDKKKDKKRTLEPSLSVNEIEMQLDSGGMEQCKDVGVGSGRPKFDLVAHMQRCSVEGPSSEDGDEEFRDSVQSDGITISLSANDLRRPVSVFSETSIESSLSIQSIKPDKRSGTLPRPGRIRQQSLEDRERTTRMKVGIYHFNRKPTKGIQYLVRNKLLEDDPKKVAEFLVAQEGLSKEKIGEFLGAISSEFNMAVLESLVEHVYIGDKPIDEALREFQQLFRMPGEAQKIDKIMEVFAMEYFKNSKSHGVFKTEDGAYILSFSIMMLHTSLHNPSVRSRPTKRQWLTQNRGINDGESFPDALLNEIFDRIQANAFVTGKDHTHVVAELEKQITGSTIDSLCTSQRFLVCKSMVTEVLELGARAGFRNRHRRQLFLFNDIAVVCKKRSHDQFVFKDTFSLHNLQYITFETSHYKHGVQLHAQDRDSPYQFNCDSRTERETILQHLDDILDHLNLLESERIKELGSTLVTSTPDSAHTASQTCHAGDLITTRSLTMDTSTLKKKRGDFVDGVGDLAVSLPTTLSRQLSGNRISQDSGFNSHQLTPTPPLSPAINSLSDSEAGTPGSVTAAAENGNYSGPRSVTPSAPRVTTAQNGSSLGVNRPMRSKSTDGIHRLGVNSEAPRSPSMEFPGKRRSSGQVSSSSPLVDGKKKKKEKAGKSFFGFGKGKASKENGNEAVKKEKVKHTMTLSRAERDTSASPQTHKKLVQTMTDSLDRSLVSSSELTKTLPH